MIESKEKKTSNGATWGKAFLLVAGGMGILYPNFVKARAQGHLIDCKSNFHNLETALEMYATDNGGLYPSRLSDIVPKYMSNISLCPAAGLDTYSASYQRAVYSPDVAGSCDAFTICCTGLHHTSAGLKLANYPLCTSYSGILMP